MPHALFLGSALATQDRVSDALPDKEGDLPAPILAKIAIKVKVRRFVSSLFQFSRAERSTTSIDYRSKHGERENNPLSFIRQHLSHGIVDVVTSLLVLAVPINSAFVYPFLDPYLTKTIIYRILILAAAVFHQGPEQLSSNQSPANLFDAHSLISTRIGNGSSNGHS